MNLLNVSYNEGKIVFKNNQEYSPSDCETSKFVADMIVGIRPENISLEKTDNSIELEASVSLVEMSGKENLLHVSMGEDNLVIIAPAGYRAEAGSKIKIYVDKNSIKYFDFNTKERIL